MFEGLPEIIGIIFFWFGVSGIAFLVIWLCAELIPEKLRNIVRGIFGGVIIGVSVTVIIMNWPHRLEAYYEFDYSSDGITHTVSKNATFAQVHTPCDHSMVFFIYFDKSVKNPNFSFESTDGNASDSVKWYLIEKNDRYASISSTFNKDGRYKIKVY